MKFELNIVYNWESDNGIDIPSGHLDALTEDAESRIFEMIKDGYTDGDLFTSVRFGKDVVEEEDEEDGISYNGRWEYNKK